MTLSIKIIRLRKLLKEARQYIADAGCDQDPETQRLSSELLNAIDAELLRDEHKGETK